MLFVNSADSHGQKYGFDFELFGVVVKDESRWNTKGRNVIFNLVKKEADSWSRITKEKTKNARINIDWNRWVDSDDEEEEGDKGVNKDFDPSMMQNFGGNQGQGNQGMDMASMMSQMGGANGGNGGNMDMASMMSQMNGGGQQDGKMDMAAMMQQMQAMQSMQGNDGPDSDDEDEEQEASTDPAKKDAL